MVVVSLSMGKEPLVMKMREQQRLCAPEPRSSSGNVYVKSQKYTPLLGMEMMRGEPIG